ncbi:unnamed protein product [Owenia fusiformis]|uniref:Uncharacterized protein n=1 Tax=Owenia fusiformis TaxID=6347 RepID=A0A8J1TZZ3_OWEFU|nr:unnamed protein product [Owenia fusiformis]
MESAPEVSSDRCESPVSNNFGEEMVIREVTETSSEPDTLTSYNSTIPSSLREPTESEDFSLLSLQVNGNTQCFDPATERKFANLPNLSDGQCAILFDRLNLQDSYIHKADRCKDVTSVVQAVQRKGNLRGDVQIFDGVIHRPDIARAVRELNGPKLNRETPLGKLKHSVRHRLILALSVERDDLKDWRSLAEYLNFDDYIKLWSQKYKLPAEPLFTAWSIRHDATVGTLFDFLIMNDMGMIADIL